MTVILHFLLNLLLLVGSFIPFVIAVYLAFIKTSSSSPTIERVIRGLSLFAATLVILGADALGLTIGRFAVHQLSDPGITGIVIRLFLAALCGSAGIGSAIYLVNKLEDSTNIAIRVVVFVGMLAHVELLDIYINTVRLDGFAIGPGAIPGIAFIVGMILYIALKYDPDEPRGGSFKRLRHGFARSMAGSAYPPREEVPLDPSSRPKLFD